MSSRNHTGQYRIGKIDGTNFHTRGGASSEKQAKKKLAALVDANTPDNVYGYGKVNDPKDHSPTKLSDFVPGTVVKSHTPKVNNNKKKKVDPNLSEQQAAVEEAIANAQ